MAPAGSGWFRMVPAQLLKNDESQCGWFRMVPPAWLRLFPTGPRPTAENLLIPMRLVPSGSDWFRMVPTGSRDESHAAGSEWSRPPGYDWFRLVPARPLKTCENLCGWFRLVPNGSDWFRLAPTGSDWFSPNRGKTKADAAGSKWSRPPGYDCFRLAR